MAAATDVHAAGNHLPLAGQRTNKVTTFVEWMKLDLEYVDRWSLSLDLKILLRTIPAVIGGRGAY